MSAGEPAGDRDPNIHPALWRVGEEPPAPLMLVIGSRLGPAGTLRVLAKAVQETRNDFAERATRWRADCDRAQAEGDDLRQALWHGMAMTWSHAAETLDEMVYTEFNLLGQVEAWDPPSREVTLETGRRTGRNVDRPDFPLPDTGGMVGKLLALLRDQRDQCVALAVLERDLAQEWADDGATDHPEYHAHDNRATTWAMAADRIDAFIAEAFGLTGSYQTFLAAFGPWLGLIA